MLNVYITIDTEYWLARHKRLPHAGMEGNYPRSIAGETSSGAVGIHYQMDVLERYGLKGVFFVDPMPAMLWGPRATAAIVEPIVARGHDVQLHLHTEWLGFAADGPVPAKRGGRNISDYSLEEQIELIAWARAELVRAGADDPVAFRAGNYGASDQTLQALAHLGIAYDTSFCPGISGSDCTIGLPATCNAPLYHEGVVEVPIGSIAGPRATQRHAQFTALSTWELTAAIHHAAAQGSAGFTVVAHSFELMCRNRLYTNRIVKARFEQFCAAIAASSDMRTATYRDQPPKPAPDDTLPLLPHNPVRTIARMGEQIVGNSLYGRK